MERYQIDENSGAMGQYVISAMLLRDPLLHRVPTIEGYKILGKTVLLERVGEGGMGVVYRGWHVAFRFIVAVKVLKPSLAASHDYVTRFRQEAQAALKINHQNIVRAHGVEERHGLHFLVMEFVDGESTRQRIGRTGRMQPRAALATITGAAAGLAEAHAHGLVHGDIKPSNLLIARTGRVKVVDLGLVRPVVDLADGESTPQPAILGTPQYMPPEQWEDALARPTGDVWALGATLYYLLTGQHGVPKLPRREVRTWVRDNDFPTLRGVLSMLPELERVFDRCVDPDPEMRFATGAELHQALLALGPTEEELLQDPTVGPGQSEAGLPPHDVLARIEGALNRPAPIVRRRRRVRDRSQPQLSGLMAVLVVALVSLAALLFLRAGPPKTTSISTAPPQSSSDTKAASASAPEPSRSLPAPAESDAQMPRRRSEPRDAAEPHSVEAPKPPVVEPPLAPPAPPPEPSESPVPDAPPIAVGAPTVDQPAGLDVPLRNLPQPLITGPGNWVRDGDDLLQTVVDRSTPTLIMFGDPSWSDYDVVVGGLTEKGSQGFRVLFHATDENNYAYFSVGDNSNNSCERWAITPGKSRRFPANYKSEYRLDLKKWHEVRLVVRKHKVTCWLDKKIIFNGPEEPCFASGRIGLGCVDAAVRFRSLRVVAPDGRELWSGFPPFGGPDPPVSGQGGPGAALQDSFIPATPSTPRTIGGRPGAAIEAALAWLARHQDEDGKWDCDAFMGHDVPGDVCDGPGQSRHDVGITGLAVLAFLAAGYGPETKPHAAVVRQALGWLVTQQSDGLYGTNGAHDFIYEHAIATQAMAVAGKNIGGARWIESAKQGVDYLLRHRNPDCVWRYRPHDNDNDLSVTAWCAAACKAGQSIGCKVDDKVFADIATYLDMVSDATGLHGYTKPAERSARMPGEHKTRFPPEKGEAMTAVGLSCRKLLGQGNTERVDAAAALLVAKPPTKDPKAVDYYYWYYGSKALRAVGGSSLTRWRQALSEVLLPAQRLQGSRTGSWDPVDVWGEEQGRVGSTAFACLALTAAFAESAGR